MPRHPDHRAGSLLLASVTRSDDPSHAEVRLSGELDGSEAGSLDAVLHGLLRAGCRRVVVDLAGLRFLGCAGLTVFVRAHSRACETGAQVLLTRPTPMITRVLRITALDLVLTVRTDRDTATGRPAGSSTSRDAA